MAMTDRMMIGPAKRVGGVRVKRDREPDKP